MSETVDWPPHPQLHLALPLPGRRSRIICAYIRKNASTSLTNYLEQSLQQMRTASEQSNTRFRDLAVAHGYLSPDEPRPKDITACILRCPVQRFYSAFCSKIVARSGAEDLWESIHQRVGHSARDLSMREFVATYFKGQNGNPEKRIDFHFVPQSHHLWPINYRFRIHLSDLYRWAVTVFGQQVAMRFFLIRTNATEAPGDDPPDDSTISELQSRFAKGLGPPSIGWLDRQVGVQIREIYSQDETLLKGPDFWTPTDIAEVVPH